VLEVEGTANAGRSGTPGRGLVPGAIIQEGEHVSTGADSHAVLVFRDGSRVALTANSELAVTRFDFDESAPARGQANMRLVSGGAHVRTGQLARIAPDAFVFETAAGAVRTKGGGAFTVAPRPAGRAASAHPSDELMLKSVMAQSLSDEWGAERGFGIVRTAGARLNVAAAGGPESTDDVLVIHTSDGTVIIQTATERIEIPKSATLAVTIVDGKITFLPATPAHLLQIGALVPGDAGDPSTFGQGAPLERGLYVWVRDGAVTLGLGQDQKPIELTAGQAAHFGGQGIKVLDFVPNVLRFDLAMRSNLAAAGPVLKFFRASDGSITRMCK
jgi:hypothetical protein